MGLRIYVMADDAPSLISDAFISEPSPNRYGEIYPLASSSVEAQFETARLSHHIQYKKASRPLQNINLQVTPPQEAF